MSMVVDTSALFAILLKEPEGKRFAEAIERDDGPIISAVSVLEAGILAISRKGEEGRRQLDALVNVAGLAVVPFDAEQAALARDAFEQYGKGRHPARLNFGDCAVYALAASRALPILFKGDDFSRTDLEAVSAPR